LKIFAILPLENETARDIFCLKNPATCQLATFSLQTTVKALLKNLIQVKVPLAFFNFENLQSRICFPSPGYFPVENCRAMSGLVFQFENCCLNCC